jgi:ferric-dicitrate binding protein FerR (iron transport regulator)
MNEILKRVRSFFLPLKKEELLPPELDEVLGQTFGDLQNVDPKTREQWLRLERSLSKSEPAYAGIRPRLAPRFALALALLVAIGGGAYLYIRLSQPEMFFTVKGEQKEISLHDGSTVTLSHTTELVVPKRSMNEPREVELKGEAYFRVRKGETPFIVSTALGEVRVVGTEFNLRARGETLEVAVLEGRVQVTVTRDGKENSLIVSAHQMVLIPADGFPPAVNTVPSPDYPGWLHGKLFLNRTTLADACREIEMRFDVSINILDQPKTSEVITGVLRATSAESAVAALCEVTGSSFRHHDGRYEVF